MPLTVERVLQDEDGECNLDDKFAGPLGVLSCLREDAADIGFVDHWTAWGAGQVGDEAQANATLRNMGDFKVVCDDGCRDLDDALEVWRLVSPSKLFCSALSFFCAVGVLFRRFSFISPACCCPLCQACFAT